MSQDNASNVVVTQQLAAAAITIANAGEVVAAVITRIAGNDLSTAINGQTLTRDSIQSLAVSKFRDVMVADLKG